MMIFDRSKPVLVFLATGVQGSAVVRAACAHGLHVRALVRSTASDIVSKAGIVAPGVTLVQGDLDDTVSLEAACQGLDHAVVQIPTGPAPEMVSRARNAFTAFRQAGLRGVVLKLSSASRPAPCLEPSFLANAALEAVASESGVPFSIVRPTLYLDNLLKPSALADLRTHGVFAPPIPSDQRIAWTSAEDCARAALTLIERTLLAKTTP